MMITIPSCSAAPNQFLIFLRFPAAPCTTRPDLGDLPPPLTLPTRRIEDAILVNQEVESGALHKKIMTHILSAASSLLWASVAPLSRQSQ
jgi:hypothetical protein